MAGKYCCQRQVVATQLDMNEWNSVHYEGASLSIYGTFVPRTIGKSSAKYLGTAKQIVSNRVLLFEGYAKIRGVDDEH